MSAVRNNGTENEYVRWIHVHFFRAFCLCLLDCGHWECCLLTFLCTVFFSFSSESFSSSYSSPKQARVLPPLRPGMPVAKRQNLFRLKLELCSVRYNFSDPTTARDREIKRQTLLELIKFTNTPSGQKVFCDSSMPHVLKMLEANIFREMPAECQDLEMEEDEMPVQSEWPHLQAVYEFMLRFIVSAEVKPKIARKHLHRNFCKNIIALFDSEDPRERDYLKTILHRIYGKFMTYRSLIRRHIQYVFYEFLFEKGQHNGIGELLEILGSIINGFQLPLKKEHLEFLAHTLIPLHKTTSIQFYHLQLSYCMTQYIEKDRNTAIPIVLGILKFWPWSSTSKQLLLFNELEDIMELISPTVLERVVSVCVRACATACVLGRLTLELGSRGWEAVSAHQKCCCFWFPRRPSPCSSTSGNVLAVITSKCRSAACSCGTTSTWCPMVACRGSSARPLCVTYTTT